ncbi:MAG: class I mannose-6-phosphate isomerase [Candidatus Hydrogenedentota bacterium]
MIAVKPVFVKKEWGSETWLFSPIKPYITELKSRKKKIVSVKKLPVLLKYIDAKNRNSVQVHPDDILAKKLYNDLNGKNEVWIILDSGSYGYIYLGFIKRYSHKKISEKLKNGKIKEILKKVYIKEGDVVYIPAGTIHCLMEGMKVIEVQQPSDRTFRFYDWDRVYKGRKRELHIDYALRAIKFNKTARVYGNIFKQFDFVFPDFKINISRIHNRIRIKIKKLVLILSMNKQLFNTYYENKTDISTRIKK